MNYKELKKASDKINAAGKRLKRSQKINNQTKLEHKYDKKITLNLQDIANKLNADLPRSEQWFHKLYQPYKHLTDNYNQVVNNEYIGDVVNDSHKYVIEIDGTAHDNSKQRVKDCIKDIVLESLGYRVLRVEAYNDNSAIDVIQEVLFIRDDNSY